MADVVYTKTTAPDYSDVTGSIIQERRSESRIMELRWMDQHRRYRGKAARSY